MDISKCFRDAWGLFKADLGPLMVTAVIGSVIIGGVAALAVGASVLAVVSGSGLAVGGAVVGVLVTVVVSVVVGGWMYATLYGMLLARVRRRVAATYGDLTRFFVMVGPFILATFVLGLIISVGYALLLVPGFIFMTWWLLTLVIMADQRIGFTEAMSASKEFSKKVGFWNMLATWLVGAIAWGVAGAILSWIPYFGNILLMLIVPFALAYTVSMYLQARGEGHLIDEALGLAPEAGDAARSQEGLPAAPSPGPSVDATPAPASPPVTDQASAGGDDAWRAAADPVAAESVSQQAEAPAGAEEAAAPPEQGSAADDAGAPEAPEAPPAPEPPLPPTLEQS